MAILGCLWRLSPRREGPKGADLPRLSGAAGSGEHPEAQVPAKRVRERDREAVGLLWIRKKLKVEKPKKRLTKAAGEC